MRTEMDMHFGRASAVWVCLTIGASPAYGSCLAVNTTRLFAAQTGEAYLRADLAGAPTGRSMARLYLFSVTGEHLVWTATLANVPQTIWIDPIGRWVVTLGNHCNSPSDQEHALTVYDERGRLIADWTLNELVPDLHKHVSVFEVHTPWTSEAPLRFEAPFNELRVIFPWGESKVVSRKPAK